MLRGQHELRMSEKIVDMSLCQSFHADLLIFRSFDMD